MTKSYQWKPIEDLPEDWQKLASSELAGLFAVWKEQVERLKDSPAYQEFQARLRREWAIETGIIEGLYDIDRGVTRTLIERGLHASLIAHGDANKPGEQIILMLKDHELVVEGLFDFVGQQRQLSTSYIKQIHQALTDHQETTEAVDSLGRLVQVPLLRGEWKTRPNNPTRPDGGLHEYCPPEQVASEMDQLIEIHQRHLELGVPPEVEAAWLHHRFTQIHPFQDGNGRVARALASLVFIRAGWFPFVVNRDERVTYIEALERADAGDLVPLVFLVVAIQKKAVNQALRLAEQPFVPGDALWQVVDAVTDQLKARKHKQKEKVARIRALERFAEERLRPLADTLNNKFQAIDPEYKVFFQINQDYAAGSFDHQVKATAEKLNYQANTNEYVTWQMLLLRAESLAEIVFSFHGWGESSLGVKAVSAFLLWPVELRNGYLDLGEPTPLSTAPFQCTDKEVEDKMMARFQHWIDEVLLVGLAQWRKQL